MKLKYHRVARSGPTIDGREITPAQIDQMAASYNPAKYPARVWLEHLRSMLPDGAFRAYGDVLSLKAETDAEGARVLLAQIDATPDLMNLSAARQKVFFSIEMHPKFPGTGEAYMVGLSVTDSPASLGTEMLTFAVQSPNAPTEAKDHLYSQAVESDALAEEEPEKPGFVARVMELLSSTTKTTETRNAQTQAGVLAVAEEVAALRTATDGFAAKGEVETVAAAVAKLSADVEAVVAKLSNTPVAPPRSPASGSAANLTDC
jgi:hypothetical protein